MYREMKKKVYISGAISGLPEDEVRERFEKYCKVVREEGLEPVSPLDLRGEERDWHKCMMKCVAVLPECDGILFIDDPKTTSSFGVLIEGIWAAKLGLPRIVI